MFPTGRHPALWTERSSSLRTRAEFHEDSVTNIPYTCWKIPQKLLAKGRAVLRKRFSHTPPIHLPNGHPSVAFCEPQIHAILRTISAEIIQSSVYVLEALSMHAAQGGIQTRPVSEDS